MERIAQVVVDVPTMQTDIPYSYKIPALLSNVLEVGMRVVVPFGRGERRIQGFIVEIVTPTGENQTDNLKEIIAPMDLHPVLNSELLALGDYMQRKTFSFKITCFQTMLPRVMRADYAKYLVLVDEVDERTLYEIFKGKDYLAWEEAEAEGTLPYLLDLKKSGKIAVHYEVSKRNKAKTKKAFKSRLTFEQIEEERDSLRKNAQQQLALLNVLQQSSECVTYQKAREKAGITPATIKTGEKKGWLEIVEVEVRRDPFADIEVQRDVPQKLNGEQEQAYRKITEAVAQKNNPTFLLQGVTGSGKTEVYLQSIAYVLNEQRTAMMLVPEIALTPQMTQRFKARFGEQVAVLHSGLSDGEKYDEWRKIEEGEARVVVGARSAVFAPLENIGLIILDEEHETTYKQDDNPRYHARDIARWRAAYHHCPVVLGSATPSLESRARAQKDVYQLLVLSERAVQAATLPDIEIIDMTKVATIGNMQTFSAPLLDEINIRLAKQEQIVLLLNRRGYSSFMMCRDCGYVLPCPNCDISLTLHMDVKRMKCHYCGHEEAIPHQCPQCRSDKIRYYGTGTQKVEEELHELLPTANILRMDVDTTRRKGAHRRLLEQFEQHKADILLGTQMIAKGLDFPNVTLVGVLNADTSLNLPDFRASEKTYQLLTQVSGRAGRGAKSGKVMIQSFNPQHYAIQLVKKQSYETFYRYEMQARHQGNYPPYFYTVQIVASHTEEREAAKKMFEVASYLKENLSQNVIILGPTPSAIMRVNKRYYYQLVIKYKHEPMLSSVLKTIMEESQADMRRGLLLSIDVEPMHFI
ncbi:primosomal protein N' [Vagococcus lutrae]|uniref:primosomal protein N' n=1 Tax=Vagococcus lutrae TaxID=81947 RepID=UPI0019256487|nr:primosomal protein N' [Vagococcus lutrae]GEQ61502.1 primosomal protein N' [Vagococcus lutrae]GEQ63482.1 primosomal protein N' [Vagococcus lutrae]GEQ65373.1 primosomal protein N' [Vagococcus lutrae]